jgi:hypothetical protein
VCEFTQLLVSFCFLFARGINSALYKCAAVERRVKTIHSEAREMINRVNRLVFLMRSICFPPFRPSALPRPVLFS